MKQDKYLESLIDGYCSGILTDEEFFELNEALRNDPTLRRELIKSRILDSDLRTYATAVEQEFDANSPRNSVRTIRRQRIKIWAMAATITVLLIGIGILTLRPERKTETVVLETPNIDSGVVVLARALDAEWKDQPMRPGDSMAPGRWQLVSGAAELEFYSGASVILEAPADLEILSENNGILHSGKLRAEVPLHAHGFTIQTKAVKLVDLGTSFGIEVGPDENTVVQVFDGKVELFDPESKHQPDDSHKLSAGEGRLFSPTGEIKQIKVDPSGFMAPSQLEAKSVAKFQAWQQASQATFRDPRLIAAYSFQRSPDLPPRTLSNFSANKDERLQGTIIGAQWSQGRWPEKDALDFKRPSDRVKINIPSGQTSVTLVTWLRIDGFDNAFHSILLSEGWNRNGALHWQIHKDGFVELAVLISKDHRLNNSRAPFRMKPSDFGRWMQLAVVYDGKKGTVTHYRDDTLTGVVKLAKTVKIAIGKAELGNWTPPKLINRAIRNFNGRMDELLIFDGVLTHQDIKKLHENGMP